MEREQQGSSREVGAVEEAMVPELSLFSYLSLGLAQLRMQPGVLFRKLLSEGLGLLVLLAPALLVLDLHRRQPPRTPESYAMAARRGQSAVEGGAELPLVMPEVHEPLPILDQAGWPELAFAFGIIGVLVLAIALRAFLETDALGRLRDRLERRERTLRDRLRQGLGSQLAVGLLQFALVTAATLIVAPATLRMLLAEVAPTASPMLRLLPLAVSTTVIGAAWLGGLITAAWATWRPAFVAGSFLSAFGMPFRETGLFFMLLVRWVLLFSGLWALLTLLLLSASTPLAGPVLFAAGLLVSTHLLLASLFAAGLTVLVGHRIGEVAIRPLDPVLRAELRYEGDDIGTEMGGQSRIRRHLPGLYRGPSTDATAAIPFHVLLGYEPVRGDRTHWQLPAGLARAFVAHDIENAASGVPELRLEAEPDTVVDAPALPSPADARKAPPSLLAERLYTWPTSIDGPYEGEDALGDLRGFERLTRSLLPMVQRTRSGDVELLFRAFRPPSPNVSGGDEGQRRQYPSEAQKKPSAQSQSE